MKLKNHDVVTFYKSRKPRGKYPTSLQCLFHNIIIIQCTYNYCMTQSTSIIEDAIGIVNSMVESAIWGLILPSAISRLTSASYGCY